MHISSGTTANMKQYNAQLRKQKISNDEHGIVFITHAHIHNELKDLAKWVDNKLNNIKSLLMESLCTHE